MNYGDTLRQRLRVDRALPKIRWEARKLVAPVVASRVALNRADPFVLWGEEYRYFVDAHNMTWRNERAVELAIAKRFVAEQSGRGMEFGNVLAHYGRAGGQIVVDKYESAEGVTNADIVDYRPPAPFDFIVSISTLEHVGWDERPREMTKVDSAFARLTEMLTPGGRMLLTAPTGHHPGLDQALLNGRWPVTRLATLVRTDQDANLWTQAPEPESRPYVVENGRGADAVWVVEVVAPSDRRV